MKVAVSTDQGYVSAHFGRYSSYTTFGRARYFMIIDPETLNFEVIENHNVQTTQGAGIQTAQLISSKNVAIVLTGNCGPNAQSVLQSSGIRVITGIEGKVKDVLSKYKSEVK